jgi:hypothetical protein
MKLPPPERRLPHRIFFWLYLGMGIICIGFGLLVLASSHGSARPFGLALFGILALFGLLRIRLAVRQLRLLKNKLSDAK